MRRLTTDEFIEKAKKVHGDFFNYKYVNYVNNKVKVKIICPLHGETLQSPENHLRFGCYSCRLKNQLGTNKYKPSNLYYISFEYAGNTYYKLGITNLDVAKRYKNQKFQNFKIIYERRFTTGNEAIDIEQFILNTYNEYRGALPKEIYGDGYSEVFSINIFDTLNTTEIDSIIDTIIDNRATQINRLDLKEQNDDK